MLRSHVLSLADGDARRCLVGARLLLLFLSYIVEWPRELLRRFLSPLDCVIKENVLLWWDSHLVQLVSLAVRSARSSMILFVLVPNYLQARAGQIVLGRLSQVRVILTHLLMAVLQDDLLVTLYCKEGALGIRTLFDALPGAAVVSSSERHVVKATQEVPVAAGYMRLRVARHLRVGLSVKLFEWLLELGRIAVGSSGIRMIIEQFRLRSQKS